MCHSEASQHIDWVTETGLYERLTTVIGSKGADCKGSTPVVPNMAEQSLLVRIVKGSTMCVAEGGGMQEIPKMPHMCPQNNRPCLTDAQVKTISDWIAGGAPQ
jgi:hypothetical protein